jgi:hypothetical protein
LHLQVEFTTYNRGAFLKHSALLAAASVFSNPLLSHASSQARFVPILNHYSNDLLSDDSALREPELNSFAMQQSPPSPFFANTNLLSILSLPAATMADDFCPSYKYVISGRKLLFKAVGLNQKEYLNFN